ncbi:MAG: glycosyltransferase [bacterium]|nr:glycosyltransferase [bacterium]
MTSSSTAPPIKILHITDQLSKGGAGRALIGLAKYSARLSSFQHECISIKPLFDGVVSENVTEGLKVYVAPTSAQMRSLIAAADIVQWHWWQEITLMKSDFPTKPIMVWCAVSGEYSPNELPRSVVKFADLMVVTNPLTYDLPAIRSLQEEERHRKVRLIFESADFERILPIEKIPHDTFNVGWVGTISPGKFHPRYIEMSNQIRIPNVQFMICGEGSLKEKATREALQLGAVDRFCFLGYQNDMRNFFGALDVYGFPLDEKTFAGGELNLQEAMIAGLPIVILPYGGPKRMILHNYNGYIAYSDREYRDYIEFLFHHPEERERLGKNAHDYALHEFGAENAARKFNQLYRELLESKSVPIETAAPIAKKDAAPRNEALKQVVSKVEPPKAAAKIDQPPKTALDDSEINRLQTRLYEKKSEVKQTESAPTQQSEYEKVIDKRTQDDYKVTAIVSTYNSADVIAGCLDDLAEQTLYQRGDLEIVVIDSASPQNEWEIIKNFADEHEHILAVRTRQRETLYAAWNRAIRLSHGEYITNANADDRHKRNALEVLALVLSDYSEVAVAYGDVLKTNRANESFEVNSARSAFRWGPFSLEKLEDHCCVGPQPMWQRSLHNEIGLFDERYSAAADYDFWLRAALYHPLHHVNQVLGLYLDNPQSLEHLDLTNHYERVDVLNRHHLRKSAPLESQPLVSIIIPTLDRPKQLKDTLRSLLDQTYKNWEALVINDGGAVLKLGEGGVPADERIRIINLPENHERSYCRNFGIKEACGKYVAFLDDDDVFYRHHLDLAVGALETDIAGRKVWYGNSCEATGILENDGFKIAHTRLAYSAPFDRKQLLVNNYIPILALVFNREVFSGHLFNEEMNLLEDYDLLIRLSRKYHFLHQNLVTNEFRTYSLRSVEELNRHRAQYEKLYKRYRDQTEDEWELQWEQRKYLRSIDFIKYEIGRKFPPCSIILSAEQCDEKALKLVAEIHQRTMYPNADILIVLPYNQLDAARKSPLKKNLLVSRQGSSWAQAMNDAAQTVAGECLVLLDGGCLPKFNNWLFELTTAHDQLGAGVVAGIEVLSPENTLLADASLALDRNLKKVVRLYPDFPYYHPRLSDIRPVDAVTPGLALMSREKFLQCGGFDAALSPTAAWIDLCAKLRLKHELAVILNPFAQVIKVQQTTSIDVNLPGPELNLLQSRWGRHFMRTDLEWFVQDGFYQLAGDSKAAEPSFTHAYAEIITSAQNLINQNRPLEAFVVMNPLLRIYPNDERVTVMIKSCAERAKKANLIPA